MTKDSYEPKIKTILDIFRPARPCTAQDITWGPHGGQCLNCGGEGPSCFDVTHKKGNKVSR